MGGQIPSKKNLKRLIDTCFDAVNESKAGPIFMKLNGQEAMNHVGFHTYMTLVQNLCPHQAVKIAEPQDKWQQVEGGGEDEII